MTNPAVNATGSQPQQMCLSCSLIVNYRLLVDILQIILCGPAMGRVVRALPRATTLVDDYSTI